jgi:HEAT repeat protein
MSEIDQWIDQLDHQSRSLREAAAASLLACGEEAVPGLCAAMVDDRKEPDVRRQAAILLGRIGDPRAAESLCRVLREETLGVWEAAASALAGLRDPQVLEPLCRLLWENDPDVRRRAASVLGEIGEARAIEPLCWSLRDPNEGVRDKAADALVQIGPLAVDTLCRMLRDQTPDLSARVQAALVRIGAGAVVGLCRTLQDADPQLRRRSAEALGRIGDREPLPVLRARLRPFVGEQDAKVRTSIRAAIQRIEDATADTTGLPRTAAPETPSLSARPRVGDPLPPAEKRPREGGSRE